MALEFIYGPASCHHEEPLVERARDFLIKDENNQVFYLVPNHVKFETEVAVLNDLHKLSPFNKAKTMAMMRLQVFSFTRLAWYFLQNTEYYQDEQLTEAGNHMLIRKVLLDEAENLHVFKGEVGQPGFIKQLAELFSELQEGKIEEPDIEELLSELGETAKENDFKKKLKEFYLLYQVYCQQLGQRQVGMTQSISYLAEYLKDYDLSNMMFVITGYSRFTAREKELVEILIRKAGEVKIDLVLDRAHVTKPPEGLDMFFDTGKLYYELYQYARHNQVKLLRDYHLKCDQSQPLTQLDIAWRESQKLTPNKEVHQLSESCVHLWESETPFAEISQVAKEIRKLIASGYCRYQDIEILSRDLPSYQALIEPVFSSHEIPFYLNSELEMRHHPLVEFLETLFLIKKRYFRYSDIMRFLRTELFVPQEESLLSLKDWQYQRQCHRSQVDLTENVVLAYGYEGHAWVKEKDWVYVQYDFEESEERLDENRKGQESSNVIRRHIRDYLVPFYDRLDQAKTGLEAAKLLYDFLLTSGVERELLYWRDQDIEKGHLDQAKIHEQTWQAFVILLDDYVKILGDEVFNFDDFYMIIKTGLEGLTYSKVPTTLDQVTVSSLDLIHAQKNKVTFVIGTTDNVLPKKIENKTLLSDDERQLFSNSLTDGKFLSKNTQSDLAKEPYIAYLAFHSTDGKLYITYPRSNDRVKEIKPSPYVNVIQHALNLEIEPRYNSPSVEHFSLNQIGTYRTLLTDLVNLKRRALEEKQEIANTWQVLETILGKQPQYNLLSRKIFKSLKHKNISEPLKPELVTSLYGETIYGSVSKIENFNQCQYKYFMTYGLKLRERDRFELSPAATGDFYHDALDHLFKALITKKLVLSELTTSQLTELTEEVLQRILGDAKFTILTASNRMNYIRYQLSETIKRVSRGLQRQSQIAGFSNVKTEVMFGQLVQEKGLNSLLIPLDNHKKMEIRGKIDRLDKIETKDNTYLAVVDYKSSDHSFDYRDAYFGLAMQMITYLDVALQNAVSLIGTEGVKPAGAFYLQVKNPILEGGTSEEQLESQLLKEFSYKGILLEDENLLDTLDPTVKSSGSSSLVFPYKETKKGYKSTQFVSEEEVDLLIQHNRENFKKAGNAIFTGETAINPAYRDKKRVACEYCPFRSVCQFDVLLKENNYKRIDSLKKADAIKKMTPCSEKENKRGMLDDTDK
ncbi:PD-(D/E)XK nuclease family protein [Vagococcus intermedius]|uniref:ATP-dependent helicase/deoxyribonuclease subunit B n=1 Tax=Vagococcus intermedius TaxID=2991418 RepID=A0AAF0CWR3_9ENTE|nr:PD-(D/E)XK nuclease family protein [Vagococcus intermedius]WEG74122.1 PD-(D/E)XK nuclease family protein [Vagococcus intermedius]WEG76202.1 PD-(D/E)XK nuclease family protein [Vagococcus intermedius]